MFCMERTRLMFSQEQNLNRELSPVRLWRMKFTHELGWRSHLLLPWCTPLQPFFPHTSLSAPCYCTHLFPFQMVMPLTHAGVLQPEVNSLFLEENLWIHVVLLRLGSAGMENFPLWSNNNGHRLSSVSQHTVRSLGFVIMQKPASVPIMYTDPPHLLHKNNCWWYVVNGALLVFWPLSKCASCARKNESCSVKLV